MNLDDAARAAAAGDRVALDLVLATARDQLRRVIARRLPGVRPQSLSDTASETCERLAERYKRGQILPTSWKVLSAYMMRMARTVARDRRRQSGRTPQGPAGEDEEAPGFLESVLSREWTPSEAAAMHESAAALREGILRLPEVDQRIVGLHVYEGLPFKAVAEVLRLRDEDAARARYGRIRKKLRQHLDP